MAGNSIFNKIVRSEDAYTQLLCNLMKRNDEFAELVLNLFLSNGPSPKALPKIKDCRVETQTSLKKFGRPDILINAPNLIAAVEVKVRLTRVLTDNQRPTHREVRGYIGFLRKQHNRNRGRWLVFLVPRGWKYYEELQDALKDTLRHYSDVKGKLISWEQVREIASLTRNSDPFLDEFRKLLRTFTLTFSGEEIEKMYSKNFPIREALTLQAFVRKIRKRAKGKSGVDSEESGFYLADSCFFCGIWADAWEQEGLPLTFGIHDEAPPALSKAFRKAYKGKTWPLDGWTVGRVPRELLSGDDAVDKVWKYLRPIIEKVNDAT